MITVYVKVVVVVLEYMGKGGFLRWVGVVYFYRGKAVYTDYGDVAG